MPQKILFVCLGNICRSPAAQGVFRDMMPDAETDSAGTSGWHIGEPPYGPMQAAARTRGIEIGDLRARRFEAADFDLFDLILGMDSRNISDIEALRPDGNSTLVRSLAEFVAGGTAIEIPDPYYTRDFDGALDLISDAATGLIAELHKRAPGRL